MITENLSPKLKYRPDIDGLRAIAVMLVVFFHAFPETFKSGFIGVDIFFVISGFLISTIIFEAISENKFSYIQFYARRIRRIFPSLCIVLLSCLILGWIALLTVEYTQLGLHVAAGSIFSSNLLLWSESGYFDIDSASKPLLHLWSLGIEEQFYLVWPCMLILLSRFKRCHFLLLLLIAFSSFALNISLLTKYPIAAFFMPFTRFWELVIGSMVAALIFFYKHELIGINQSFKNLFSIFGLCLLVAGVALIDDKLPFPGFWTLLPVLSASFLILAGSDSIINQKVLSHPVLVSLGLISYPLYLWHWPILSFKRMIEGGQIGSIKFRLIAIAFSILMAWLTYLFIEKPIRKISSLKKTAGILIVILGMVGIFGLVVYQNNGFDQRFEIEPATGITLYRAYPHEPFHNQNCDQRYPEFQNFNACLLSKNSPPEIILIGDSHANQYYKSLSAIFNDSSVMNLGQWSCLPFSSITHQLNFDCAKKISSAEKLITESNSINTVFLTGYFSYLSSHPFAQKELGRPRYVEKPTTIEIDSFKNSAYDFLTKISKGNKKIVLMLDIPNLNFFPRDCIESKNRVIQSLRKNAFNKRILTECKISRVDYEQKNAVFKPLIEEIQRRFPMIEVFDPMASLCDENYCWAIVNEVPIYYDPDHLTIEGANKVISDLIKKINKK